MIYFFGLNFVIPPIKYTAMKFLIALILMCILFTLCWPLAVGLFFFFIIFWILLLPFAIAGFTIGLIFKIIGGILLFPFKILAAI